MRLEEDERRMQTLISGREIVNHLIRQSASKEPPWKGRVATFSIKKQTNNGTTEKWTLRASKAAFLFPLSSDFHCRLSPPGSRLTEREEEDGVRTGLFTREQQEAREREEFGRKEASARQLLHLSCQRAFSFPFFDFFFFPEMILLRRRFPFLCICDAARHRTLFAFSLLLYSRPSTKNNASASKKKKKKSNKIKIKVKVVHSSTSQ